MLHSGLSERERYDSWQAAARGEVDYRPMEAMLVPAPWHRGAVVLVGDAAHTTPPHLAFGAGIHLCLGAPLARLEGAAVFRALAERVREIEVLPGASRTDSAAIR